MAVATEKSAETFLDIAEGVPLNNLYPLYADDEVEVIYGKESLVAVPVTDYTVELSEPDYDQFTVTPTASLITKIEDLMGDDEDEINYVTVRRKLDYLTSVQPETVRQTAFLSREIDRIHLKLIQLREESLRSLKLPAKEVGDVDEQYSMEVPTADTFAVWNADGTKLISGPTVGQFDIVAENIDDINALGPIAAEIVICADNIADINTVADEIEGVGNLAALAGLTGAADKLPYFTGSAAMALTSFGSYGRSLVAAASASAARTVLELGSAALLASSAFATAAQGAKADSALQAANIGSTVQGYNSILAGIASDNASADVSLNTLSIGTTSMSIYSGMNLLVDADGSGFGLMRGVGMDVVQLTDQNVSDMRGLELSVRIDCANPAAGFCQMWGILSTIALSDPAAEANALRNFFSQITVDEGATSTGMTAFACSNWCYGVTGSMTGFSADNTLLGNANLTGEIYGFRSNGLTSTASTVTGAPNFFHFYASGAVSIFGSPTLGSVYGMYIEDQGESQFAAAYGIYIQRQTGAPSNNNYGLYCQGNARDTFIDGNGHLSHAGHSVVSTQFDKTNSTSLANITGLTSTLLAGKKYKFYAQLFVNCGASGGYKVALSGTATATALIAKIKAYDDADASLDINARKTALNDSAGATGPTGVEILIEGEITVNAAGTFTIQFAQNASDGTTSSVLVGSNLTVERLT